MKLYVLLVCILSWTSCKSTAENWSTSDYIRDGILRYVSWNPHTRTKRDQGGFAKLSWQHCGNQHDSIIIRDLTLDPNPVRIPGRITAGISVEMTQTQASPIKARILMSKKVPLLFGFSTWVDVPCYENGLGSCTYEDLCQTRLLNSDSNCPSSLTQQNIQCRCPFYEGFYNLPPYVYDIPPPPSSVSKYFLEGEFHVKLILSRYDQNLACYETNVLLNL